MGGGDLNLKKSWHPSTFKNQERVWKEERKQAEEDARIKQMRKELEEERQVQELQRLQEAGTGKRSQRLDWMYAAPNANNAPGGSAMEDYLLGKKNVDALLRSKQNEQQVNVGVDRVGLTMTNPISERDTLAKVREDPLLAIKKRHQAQLKAIMDNPMRLKALKRKEEEKGVKKSSRHGVHSKKSKRDRSRERSPDKRRSDDRRREDVRRGDRESHDKAGHDRHRHRSRRDHDSRDRHTRD